MPASISGWRAARSADEEFAGVRTTLLMTAWAPGGSCCGPVGSGPSDSTPPPGGAVVEVVLVLLLVVVDDAGGPVVDVVPGSVVSVGSVLDVDDVVDVLDGGSV